MTDTFRTEDQDNGSISGTVATDRTDRTYTQEDPAEETQETVGTETEEALSRRHEEDKDLSAENDEKVDDETFPREYVEKLRAENAENRVKAKRADELAHRLHTALVEASGRLQDASDLPFDESHLDDPEALKNAIDSLLEAKPHLASRKVAGDIGQGATGDPQNNVSLAGMLRSRA